jgi:RNA polymerase sigma-70 factor (ECF subfamily)
MRPAREPCQQAHGAIDDDALVQLARRGQGHAFGALVRRHQARLHDLARRRLGQVDCADDMTQNAFLQVFEAIERYEPRGKFGAYLNQVLKNQCRMANRARARRLEGLRADIAPDDIATCELDREALLAGADAVARLDGKLRDIVELRHWLGLSFAEIAARVGAPIGTVRRRHFDALERLQRALDGQ